LALDPLLPATAIEAALVAGRIQRKYFRTDLSVTKKGPIDLVTAADLEVEQAFRQLITRRFPDHAVLGEESAAAGGADERARYRWIIDPVDGTTNFAHGLALFCVSIALEVDGHIELGVVFDPIANELFTAERGAGAWLNGEPLRVSPRKDLIDALLVTGFPYFVRDRPGTQLDMFGAFLRQARAVRRLGSAALDLCYVAAGRFDGYWEFELHPWDFAAGMLVVTEAGGKVTDYHGAPLPLARSQLVASNGLVHSAMREVIQRVNAGRE
jgi:myo-inositol-1(or 4)-monophosphatase